MSATWRRKAHQQILMRVLEKAHGDGQHGEDRRNAVKIGAPDSDWSGGSARAEANGPWTKRLAHEAQVIGFKIKRAIFCAENSKWSAQ